jgi:hypothetical protein
MTTTVTAHAILRYAEYVLGLDSEAIRVKLLDAARGDNGTYPLGVDDLRVRVVDRTIVTVVKQPRAYKKKRRKGKKVKTDEVLDLLGLPPIIKLGALLNGQ